jgi:hypothetical protein
VRKDDPEGRYCRGRKVRKRGYRNFPRKISTAFGELSVSIRTVECFRCGARYCPVLGALQIGPYARRELNFEHEVIESVIDTNYRRLVEGRSIDISLGGIHNIVVGSDIDDSFQDPVFAGDLSGILADGTGVKQYRGRKGELRVVVGITQSGRIEPLGCSTNTDWVAIEKDIKSRLTEAERHKIPFVYDGEPGLDTFLADVAESQRCVWHASRGLYHAMWQDGQKKKDSQQETDKIKRLIGIELPEGEFEMLKPQDIAQVRSKYEASKAEIQAMIRIFYEKGYQHGASYLENLSGRMFKHIEIWLKTGVIAPKTTSLLERIFREIGRRLKRIAWGWSDKAVTNLSKMIMIKQYKKEDWKRYWKEKLGIQGHFQIQIASVYVSSCHNF